MDFSKQTQTLQLPQELQAKLVGFQRRIWAIKIAEGLLASCFGLLISYVLVFTIDRFMDTPPALRFGLLLSGACVLGIWFPLVCHKWIWKSRRIDQVARLLRYKFPRLSDHLLGIIELVNTENDGNRSDSLCRAALKQVDKETAGVDFSGAVPKPSHIRWAVWVSVLLTLVGVSLFFVPSASKNAFLRWAMPWLGIQRYTFAQMEEIPKELFVPIAESQKMVTSLQADSPWKPTRGWLEILGIRKDVPQQGDRFAFSLPPLKTVSAARISIGDARFDVQVNPINRPEMSSLDVEIRLPEYLQQDETITRSVRGGALSVVKDSQVKFRAKTTRNLSAAFFDQASLPFKEDSFVSPSVDATETRQLTFDWRDPYGLGPKSPMKLKVNVVEDALPVLFSQLVGDEHVIINTDTLSFQVNAKDDFGVKQIGLEWNGIKYRNDAKESSVGAKIVSAGNPNATDLSVVATFTPALHGIVSEAVQVRLSAIDYYPNRQKVYSPDFTVRILTPAEHADWISKKAHEWYRRALEAYEQEKRLHRVNQNLRMLSPKQLDRPGNRQKIQDQADAERAQAVHLKKLTRWGESLIKDAVRNEEFKVEQLESLAQMQQKLKGIADQRMPSVADLLKQAADAPASPNAQDSEDQKRSSQSGKKGTKESKNNSKGGKNDSKGGKNGSGKGKDGKLFGKVLSESGAKKKQDSKGKSVAVLSGRSLSKKGLNQKQGQEKQAGQKPKSASLSANIQEFSMNPPKPKKPSTTKKIGKKEPKGGGLDLPKTLLRADAGKKPKTQKSGCPCKCKLQKAVDEQEDMLAEFQSIAEQLKKILDNLEKSTFVRRLKSMALSQLNLARDVNSSVSRQFGQRNDGLRDATRQRQQQLSKRERGHGVEFRGLWDDMKGYWRRVRKPLYEAVLKKMEKADVHQQIADIAMGIEDNLTGLSIARCELLADFLDQWAEELVEKRNSSSGFSSRKPADVPPSIILEVMRILEKEITLRKRTRGLQQAAPQLELKKYKEKIKDLENTQRSLNQRTCTVIKELGNRPTGKRKFGKQIGRLTMASVAMEDAGGWLQDLQAGSATIAAESEAIEWLLETKKTGQSSSGSGSSGSSGSSSSSSSSSGSGKSPAGGERQGKDSTSSALALLGAAENAKANMASRNTSQAVGKSSKSYPSEFREGLDKYFNKLEQSYTQ